LDRRYQKDPNVVAREIAGEQVLVPIKKQAAETAAIYVLNETGALVWDQLDGQSTLAQIRDSLVEEYEVKPEVVSADLIELLTQLQEIGVVKVVSRGV
jgi:hypothetical protein